MDTRDEMELLGEYISMYPNGEISFEEYLKQFGDDLPKVEEPSFVQRLCEKNKRVVSNTRMEDGCLNVDITLGIDNIIELINENAEINQVLIYADNKNYEGIEKLRIPGKDIKIDYIYNEFRILDPVSIDDFIEMREYINSIVNSIKELQLTPVEEIFLLYDLIKWYRYNFDPENADNARYIHSFLKTGQIICSGYSKLFAQIAKELGFNAFVCSIDSYNYADAREGGHERNAIYIDDDFYDIHGLYYLDATFDSTEHDEIGDKYGLEVQKSNLFFQLFLFTLEQYKVLFPDEKKPVTVNDVSRVIPFVQDDFECMDEDDLLKEPKIIDLETIKRICKNVKLKQRINPEQIEHIMQIFNEHNRIQQEILEMNGSDSKGFRK